MHPSEYSLIGLCSSTVKGNYIVGLYEYKHGGRYFNEKHPWQMMATALLVSEEQRASSKGRDWRGWIDISGR